MSEPETPPSSDLVEARRALVRTIEDEVARYGDGAGGRLLDPKVRDALLKVPRERFVPEAQRSRAYVNRPLPIGHGQTISQPLVVALMTQHLALEPDSRVLDVGTGSGYQTAVLAELARDVVTVEIVEPLAAQARTALEDLGYQNITYRVGDGAEVAKDLGPFDAILVAAAASRLPEALTRQLALGGRMVVPVGRRPDSQDLLLIRRDRSGDIETQTPFPVAFVPLQDGPAR